MASLAASLSSLGGVVAPSRLPPILWTNDVNRADSRRVAFRLRGVYLSAVDKSPAAHLLLAGRRSRGLLSLGLGSCRGGSGDLAVGSQLRALQKVSGTYVSLTASESSLVSMVGTAGVSALAGAGAAVSVVMAAPVTSTGAAALEDSAAGAADSSGESAAAGAAVSSETGAVGSAFSV